MWRSLVKSLLFAFVCRHVFIVIKSLGFHKTVYNHRPGECSLVPGISNGSEDLQLLSDGLVLISSGYPTLKERVPSSARGHIYVFDLNNVNINVKSLKVTGKYDPNDLRPHGISAFEDPDTGRTFVFVVNHLVSDVKDVIEIFEFHRESMTLEFIQTVNDKCMKSMNDVVAVSRGEFYFTNDWWSLNQGIRTLEQLLRLRTGGIFYCDVTSSCHEVGGPMLEPNGIQLSRDKRYLYVSQPLEQRIQIYSREESKIELIQSISVRTAPDNVFLDDAGDIWVGCHPVGYKVILHMEDTSQLSPAQVIRIKFDSSENKPHQNYDLEEIYSEDGRNISMSTAAIYYKTHLLVGTVRKGLLHCTVKAI